MSETACFCCTCTAVCGLIVVVIIHLIIVYNKGNPDSNDELMPTERLVLTRKPTMRPIHPPTNDPTLDPTMSTNYPTTQYPTESPTEYPTVEPTVRLECKSIKWEVNTKSVNYSTINYYLDSFTLKGTNNETKSNEYFHFKDVIINEDYIAFTECEAKRFFNIEINTIYNDLILPIYMDHLKPESTSFESIQKDNTFAICNYKTDFECYGGLQPLSFIDNCCFFDTQKDSKLSNKISYIQQLSLSSLIIELFGPIIVVLLYFIYKNKNARYWLASLFIIVFVVFSLDIATVIIVTTGLNNPTSLINTLSLNQCYSLSGQIILEDISNNLSQIAVFGVAEAILDLFDLVVNAFEIASSKANYNIVTYFSKKHSNNNLSIKPKNINNSFRNKSETKLDKWSIMRISVFLCLYIIDLILTSINYFIFVRPALNDYKSLQSFEYHCYNPSFVYFE